MWLGLKQRSTLPASQHNAGVGDRDRGGAQKVEDICRGGSWPVVQRALFLHDCAAISKGFV